LSTLDIELLDNVRTPVFVIEPDKNDNLVYVAFNKAALEISKFSPEDYLGRTALELYKGEYGEIAYKQHLKSFESGQAFVYTLQLPLNGKIQHIKTTLTPRKSKQGKVVQLIGTSVEVSAEQELKHVRSQAQLVTKELEEFVYLAAHDLRSPMRKVHMVADMLRDNFVDLGDGKLEAIGMLERLATNAMLMVESVLQYSEITGMEVSAEVFQLSELCDDILDGLDASDKQKIAVDDSKLYGDRVATSIVLRNLIDNALKHNQNEAISVFISASSVEAEFYTVSVSDTGRGMRNPAALFEAGESTRSKSGFGLLAIRRLIKMRGGNIHAEDRKTGQGLSVVFSLPGTIENKMQSDTFSRVAAN